MPDLAGRTLINSDGNTVPGVDVLMELVKLYRQMR